MVGEEATARDPALLGRIAEAELAFVLDPIDGTANYAAGLPLFGVMAAVIRRGEVIAAGDPRPGGRRHRARAARRGRLDGSRRTDGAAGSRVATPGAGRPDDGLRLLALPAAPSCATGSAATCRVLAACWDYRCAAHEYRLLAGGHCHFLLFNRLMPWDHAAGWLLHREAGGYSAQFDGEPYRPTVFTGGLICAPDRASWEALREALFRA